MWLTDVWFGQTLYPDTLLIHRIVLFIAVYDYFKVLINDISYRSQVSYYPFYCTLILDLQGLWRVAVIIKFVIFSFLKDASFM